METKSFSEKNARMIIGLVFGKFMPLHQGHLALINFARKNCDLLYIVVCYTEQEKIPGVIRMQWMKDELQNQMNIILVPFEYDEKELPNTSASSRATSVIWAEVFKKLLPQIDIVFSSEEYGEFVAEYMSIKHILFDKSRIKIQISASTIRKNPFKYWSFIADAAKPFFVKKVSILGSESTGKSTLVKDLSLYYDTVFVSEAGRDIVERTELCTLENLNQIAIEHSKKIIELTLKANKLLFLDTDIHITRSYAAFLFEKELIVEPWQEAANISDLYFFLETDCPFIQDGTRVNEIEREQLSFSHKKILEKNEIEYISIRGNWNDRFNKACDIINAKFFSLNA